MANSPKQKAAKEEIPDSAAQTKKKETKLYTVKFFRDWCKSCGLCSALCAKKIILKDETGLPYIKDMDSCVGCRFCEIHCPDFAITIKNRHPERRKTNGHK